MILDRQAIFSDAQAVTVTANGTDVMDLATAADIGRGEEMRFRVQVDTTFTAGGAGTLDVQLVSSAAAALTGPTVLYDTGVLALAALVAGAILVDIVVPRSAGRYLGVIYTVATGPMTAGAITAALVQSTPTPIADRPLGVTGY